MQMKARMALVSFWTFLSRFGGSDWLKGDTCDKANQDIGTARMQDSVKPLDSAPPLPPTKPGAWARPLPAYLLAGCALVLSPSHSFILQSMM